MHGHTQAGTRGEQRPAWRQEAGERPLGSRLCPQDPGAALLGAATSSEAQQCPQSGHRGHRGQGDVGQRVRSLSLLLCLDPEPGSSWSLIPTPPHTSRTSLTQRLARGLTHACANGLCNWEAGWTCDIRQVTGPLGPSVSSLAEWTGSQT